MTKFDANAYASGLTVAQITDAINAGTITRAQALAVCEAKTSRPNIRKGALARWTRVAEGLKAGNIDKDYAFTGKRADEAKPEPAPKAEAKPVLAYERAHALIGKKILSKAERDELARIVNAYVTRK